MTLNRIQKLLFTEYSDFEDHVLLECPFAQTTRDGEGIQQLHIGLTPTKLILAKDYLEWRDDPTAKEDPLVGTLELISMLPVEFVNLSVHRRKTRNTIKATFCNRQVLYFELAASFRREMFWNLWCERMKFLCPEEEQRQSESSERSESSASSSSFKIRSYQGPKAVMEEQLSNSLPLEPNLKQAYLHSFANLIQAPQRILNFAQWEERNLFLGNAYSSENHDDWRVEEKPTHMDEPEVEMLKGNHRTANQTKSRSEDYQRVYRFGSGIDENCATSLYLPANPALVCHKIREIRESQEASDEECPSTSYKFLRLCEDAVRLWERHSSKPKAYSRTSGLTPFPNHISGLGSIAVSTGVGSTLQLKRSASELSMRKAPEEVRTGIPKRLLTSSVSCDRLLDCKREDEDAPPHRSWRLRPSGSSQLYWTPEVEDWSPSPGSYKILRRHLALLHDFRKSLGSYNTLRKQLKMDITVSSWDFDSTILSYQLTVLDRDYLLMIPLSELQVLVTDKSSRNAPNVRAVIGFSNRISNLIATEIIRLDSLKMRARLVGKYINVADKLHRLHNMQSTQSVLNGLTSPAVYRLSHTWDCVRRHHYSKYKRLKTLLKLYKDVRTPLYSRMFEKFSRTPPYLPSIEWTSYGLLGLLPQASGLSGSKSYTSITSSLRGQRQRNLWRTQSAGGSLASETTKNSASSDSDLPRFEPFHRPYDWECGRALRLEAAERALKAWQNAALMYDLIESPLVREFLLKAKYLDPEESFFFSQNIEPSE